MKHASKQKWLGLSSNGSAVAAFSVVQRRGTTVDSGEADQYPATQCMLFLKSIAAVRGCASTANVCPQAKAVTILPG